MLASQNGLSSATIRQWMGDFREIRNVAKHASRLGLSFSSSKETLTINRKEIKVIHDVEIESDMNFVAHELAALVKTKRNGSSTFELAALGSSTFGLYDALGPFGLFTLFILGSFSIRPANEDISSRFIVFTLHQVKSRSLTKSLVNPVFFNGNVMGKPVLLTFGLCQLEFEHRNNGIFLYWHGRLIELIAEATKQISGSQKRENDLYPMEYKVFNADVDNKMASLFSTDILEWAQLLEPIKNHPKRWEAELETVNDALNKDPQEWVREILENLINTEVYKGKASGPIKLFNTTRLKYDTTKVLTPHYNLNIAAYDNYGKLYLSPLFALSIGPGFARFIATLTHVALFHGGDILKQSKMAMKSAKLDIHARLMKKYKDVTQWWFPETNIVKWHASSRAADAEEAEAISVIPDMRAAHSVGLEKVFLLTDCRRLVSAFELGSDDLSWGALALAPDMLGLDS
ncbi:hypothetical protein GIB67_015378, partial [Kingdonia uniflora]